MHNFTIDDTIIRAYLNGEDLSNFAQDEVFQIGQGQTTNCIFSEPHQTTKEKVNAIFSQLQSEISNFNFSDENRVKTFLGDIVEWENTITIKLVAGLPKGIKKLFRVDNSNQIKIVFDLVNLSENDDEVNDIVADINDYLGYAIILMILDMQESSEDANRISVFRHAIYCASFANYISGSNQLGYMRELGVYNTWSLIEYNAIKHIVNSTKRAEKIADDYISTVIQTNPEMIILGTTGKTVLEDKSETEAFRLYQEGPKAFLEHIFSTPELKERGSLTYAHALLNFLVPVSFITMMIIALIAYLNDNVTKLLIALMLLPCLLIMIRESVRYKMELINKTRLFIYFGAMLTIALVYVLILL